MVSNFVNPYNFIPFDSSIDPRGKEETGSSAVETDSLYTGKIGYTLKTKTPLIIPNTSNDDIFNTKEKFKKHKSYEFFSYEDLSGIKGNENGRMPAAPVIPGSEIRGMFRANYEILTDSCLPFLDSDQILHKRVSGFFAAGLMKKEEDGSYSLYEAEDCLFRTKGANNLDFTDQFYHKEKAPKAKFGRQSYIQDSLAEGQKIIITIDLRKNKEKPVVTNIVKTKKTGDRVGYLIKGKSGPEMKKNGQFTAQNKHCAHVFTAKDNLVEKKIDVSQLEQTIKMYQQNNAGVYQEYKEQWEIFKKDNNNIGEYFPVYYSMVKDKLYLSPASGTMETYKESIANIVGSKCACKDKRALCPACSLFGMVNSSGDAVASRVRFTDLQLKENNPEPLFMPKIALQELSSPKLQNMEFYLKRPSEDAQFWTYEYWIDTKGRVHLYDDTHKLELNGRKFYWHNKNTAAEAIEKNERNITTRPLCSGIEFKGDIFFEKITKEELEKLIWLINCGEVSTVIDKKSHGYKLGHAKPLGYGSVAVAVDEISVRKVVKQNSTISVAYENQTKELVDSSKNIFDNESMIIQQFDKMTDFDYVNNQVKNVPISYPKYEGVETVYTWFVCNHGKHAQATKKRGELVPESWTFSKPEHSVLPGSRTEMFFGEYMVPMEPLLKSVHKNDSSDSRDEKRKKSDGKGKGIKAKVFSVNAYGYVNLENAPDLEPAAQIPAWAVEGRIFKKGDEVLVRYKGPKTLNNGRTVHNYVIVDSE